MLSANGLGKQLDINGRTFELIRSKRRSLGLELSARGLKARAPLRMPEREIIAFIESKHAWIEKHLEGMVERPALPELKLVDGALLQLRGQNFNLMIEEGVRAKVRVQSNRIIVPVINSHTPLEHRVKSKLVKWYKEAAYHELKIRARYYANLMDVPLRRADQIYVRDYRRRWGSCDSKGKLSFNWRILQAPTAVSDYVVVHELAHCHEFNHSKRFWGIVEKQMPDYRNHEDWLDQHGHALYTF